MKAGTALGAADFAGTWRLTRVIADALGPDGKFAGRAVLEPAGPGWLDYREAGTLTLAGGGTFQAERRYRWIFEGARVAVSFADGRPFHAFRPEGAGAGTDHPCGDDLYRVTVDFTAWPEWRTVWRVTGPRKDYRMESLYRPA